MAWMFNEAKQAWEQVPDAQVPELFRSGQYSLPGEEKIKLRGKSGKVFEFDPRDAQGAFESGLYEYETGEARAARERTEKFGAHSAAEGFTGIAGHLGAARGLTMGLSDLLLTRSGLVEPETLKSFKEENKGVTTAAEIGGAVGGALLGVKATPAGLTARVGASVEKRIATELAKKGIAAGADTFGKRMLARALPTAAGGFVEGAGFGAGAKLSELVLEDEEITAEKIAAGATIGGLIGGISAAGISSMGGLIRESRLNATKLLKEVPGARRSKIHKFLDEFAAERRVKATGAKTGQVRRLIKEGKLQKLGGWLKDKGIVTATSSIDDVLAKSESVKKQAGAKIGDMLTEVDKAGRTFNMRGFVDDIAGDMTKALDESGSSLRGLAGRKATRSTARKVQNWLDDFLMGGEKIPFQRAAEQKRLLGSKINWKKNPADLTPDDQAMREIYRRLASAIDDQADNAAQAVGGKGFKAEYKAARTDYANAKQVTDWAMEEQTRRLANRWQSPSDYASMAMGFLGTMAGGGTPLSGAGAALLGSTINKIARFRGNQVAAAAADTMAGMLAVRNLSRAIDDRIDDAVRGFTSGASKAKDIGPAASVTAFHNVRFGGDDTSAEGDDWRLRTEELALIQSNPAEFADRLASRLSHVSELSDTLGTNTATVASRAAAFLHEKAPKNPAAERTLNPLISKWRPSDSQLSKFSRYVAAVNDPMSVLDDLEAGRVSREGAEALRAVYPRIYQQVQERLIEEAGQLETQMPYTSRVQLSILFGVPVDSSMDPDFVMAMQTMHAGEQVQEAQRQQAQSKQVRKKAFEDMGHAGRYETESQRLLGGSTA